MTTPPAKAIGFSNQSRRRNSSSSGTSVLDQFVGRNPWCLSGRYNFLVVPFESSPPRGGRDAVRGLPPASRKAVVPLEIRFEIFERAKSLRQSGKGYSEIQSLLLEEYDFAPAKSSLSEWFRGKHHPLGSANRFVAEPTPELAYVIGVKFGDGSINRKGYNRRIRLQSIDREFVCEFDRCISVVLQSKKHALWADRKRREIHVEARSVLLYNFLRQSLDDLRVWIEHCDKCVAAFLRGFFDSEGAISKSRNLTAYNNDAGRLRYVMKLLRKYFGVDTTGPRLGKLKGSRIERRGKAYLRNSDNYSIYVRKDSVKKFARFVGFSIMRKQRRLEGC